MKISLELNYKQVARFLIKIEHHLFYDKCQNLIFMTKVKLFFRILIIIPKKIINVLIFIQTSN